MAGGFKKGTSKFFVTVFIGFIVISFMLTGYESSKGSTSSVATVGDIPIKFREYDAEYKRQMEFYKRILGGNINSQQIEQFGLKKNALNNLIQRSLIINFAEKIGITIGPSEIKKEIKNLPYFKRNDQFDVVLYKNLLQSNGLTPVDFEKDIAHQTKAKTASNILASYPVSSKYIMERERFRKNAIMAEIIQFKKSSLEKQITISKKEIKTFLSHEKNTTRLKDIFKSKKSLLDQKEQILASHILFKSTKENEEEVHKKIKNFAKKINVKNFSKMASQYTEDLSGKGNGGDLEWFSRGRMVPEFEKAAFSAKKNTIVGPIKSNFGYHIIWVRDKKPKEEAKFENHKRKLAKDLIRNEKATEDNINKLSVKLTKEIKSQLMANNTKALNSSKSKLGLSYETKIMINRLDGVKSSLSISPENLKSLFKAPLTKPSLFVFDDGIQVTIIKGAPHSPKKPVDIEAEKNNLANIMNQKFRQNIIDNLKENVAIKINDRLL